MHALYTQAVIFIFEHGEGGSAGLILNRPTQFTIGSIGGLEALCPEFADNSLYMVRLQRLIWCVLLQSPSCSGTALDVIFSMHAHISMCI